MYMYNYNFSSQEFSCFIIIILFYTLHLCLNQFVHDDIRYLTYKKKLQWAPTVKAGDTSPAEQVIQQKWHSH